jgi:uncharacterized membrane protein YeiH
MVRDVLLAAVPTVLCEDLYAVAALAAAIVVIGHMLQLPIAPGMVAAQTTCFLLRVWRSHAAGGCSLPYDGVNKQEGEGGIR